MFTFVEGHHFKTTGTSCKEKPIHSTNNWKSAKGTRLAPLAHALLVNLLRILEIIIQLLNESGHVFSTFDYLLCFMLRQLFLQTGVQLFQTLTTEELYRYYQLVSY